VLFTSSEMELWNEFRRSTIMITIILKRACSIRSVVIVAIAGTTMAILFAQRSEAGLEATLLATTTTFIVSAHYDSISL
jgi:hypothetical protein